jgi:Holliday junction resolvase RusA-like endonuclease
MSRTKGWDQAAVDRANERMANPFREMPELSQEEMARRLKAGIPIPVAMPAPAVALVIDIDPIGAPRQTRRDAWRPSPAVQRYRAWKDKFVPACLSAGWTLGPELHVEFEIAMPASWSKKKKAEYLGAPHRSKPDIDNMVKAVCDAFGEDDSHVHTLHTTKRWAEKGRIILYL